MIPAQRPLEPAETVNEGVAEGLTSLPSEEEIAGRRGRPPAITREIAEAIVDLVASGYTASQACAILEVGRSTVIAYKANYTEFRNALTRARLQKARRAAEAREQAIQIATAAGDWRAAEALFRVEVQQLERELAQGAIAIDEVLLDFVAEEVKRRLERDGG